MSACWRIVALLAVCCVVGWWLRVGVLLGNWLVLVVHCSLVVLCCRALLVFAVCCVLFVVVVLLVVW